MAQQSASVTYTLVVNNPLTITSGTPPAATKGIAYSFQFTASGGVLPLTWTATGLPAGLTLSTSGLLSGTPTVAGSSSIVVTVTDSGT